MRVLIVQSKPELGTLWRRHLERLDGTVTVVETGDAALILLQDQYFDVIALDLVLREGSALTVADFANFNQPRANIVFVTDTTFFQTVPFFRTAQMPVHLLKRKRRQVTWRRLFIITVSRWTGTRAPNYPRSCGASKSIIGLVGMIRLGLMVSWL
jgi:CheY-like chemotaxis protein